MSTAPVQTSAPPHGQEPSAWHELDPETVTEPAGVPLQYVALLLIIVSACMAAALAIRAYVPAPAATLGRCPAPLGGEVLVVTASARADGSAIDIGCSTVRGGTKVAQ